MVQIIRQECLSCRLGRASLPGRCPFHDVSRPAGTALLTQGEPPQQVWYVKQGTVILTSVDAGGDETLCSLRGPGSLVGMELLRGEPAHCHAWALTPVVLCGLDAETFRAWVGPQNGPIGAVLEFALDEASQRQQERIALSGRAVTRVARFLAAQQHVEPGARLGLQHRTLARMLGMRAETLSRALGRLRSAGAIAPGSGVRITDMVKLEEIAGDTGNGHDHDDDHDVDDGEGEGEGNGHDHTLTPSA